MARDISVKNIPKEKQELLIKEAKDQGFFVNDERDKKKGAHIHIDSRPKKEENKEAVPFIDEVMSPLENEPQREPASTKDDTPSKQAMIEQPNLTKKDLEQTAKGAFTTGVSPEVKDKVINELSMPGEQDRIKEQAKKGQNIQPMDQLKEAFMYFGPQILASILVGPEAGAETGKLLEGYRGHLKGQEELAIKREAASGKSEMAQERLDVAKGNLEARLEDIKEQRKRTTNLQEDRKLRKGERSLRRDKQFLDFTDKQKQMFSNRNDVKSYRERKNKYQAILNLTNFKEGQQLPGGINALIARSVSGEVGVLTDADVQRAQINPDLISKLKRGYFTNIKGTMSPKDTKDIKLLVSKIMVKDDELMKEKAGLYTKAKSKWIPEKYQKDFKEDLITGGLGIDVTEKSKATLTPEQKKRLEYLRSKHRK